MSSADAHRPPETPRLLDHLIELRARLLRGAVGVILAFLGLMPFAGKLYTQLAHPLLKTLPNSGHLIATDPAGGFFVPMKLAFMTAVFVTAPWLLYQAWAFVAPGLYRREKRIALPLLVSAVTLFYVGCAFAYFVVLPAAFGFLARFTPDVVAQTPDIGKYLDFVSVIFLAFGASFELPVALVILVLLGWVTTAQLREWRGYAVVAIFAVAAVITPPDVVSQLMLAVPMCLLYEAGIIAARVVGKR
ncbi:twin-arginine translocase subunit TatC [Cognatilysobacter lacus]|uniref:Sec-independent protein translocase protein TatC n=1 Tax=Cognatilysobacter lacus TaxID=1643323 RepID=A0A5D8Z5Z9_9GAMM|nr:twin-arginine translocase subunit TatC [Lysobacter lacus]TZF88134.1 twin-arginine translocase subunit TatC [Lysobacter lacus]